MKKLMLLSQRFIQGMGLTFVTASSAMAATIGTDNQVRIGTNIATGPEVVKTILQVITAIAVILFVILLVVGGIQYLGSFGNEEATTKARKLILDAVIGLFIVLAAFGIASFVFGQFNIDITGIRTYVQR